MESTSQVNEISSMKTFLEKNEISNSTITESVSKTQEDSYEKLILVEIELIYKDGLQLLDKSYLNYDNKDELVDGRADLNEIEEEGKKSLPMDLHKSVAKLNIPFSRVKGTFIDRELSKAGRNYIKIELKPKKNKITLEAILNCFEYLNDNTFTFNFNKDNLISYFYAFSICQLFDKRREVLENLLQDLSDENILHFLKVVSTLNDDFLNSYAYWLVKYIVNRSEKLPDIWFNGYEFSRIVKFRTGSKIEFTDNKAIYTNRLNQALNISASLNFLKDYYDKVYNQEIYKYYRVNNYFNMGRVLRRKSDEGLVDDYPHYYQLLLENEPSVLLYAKRESENSQFIISKSIDDFGKYGCNYIGEVVPNFWGTSFDVFDWGYDASMYNKVPKVISPLRRKLANIKYETNIMGESPRYFNIEVYENEVHKLENYKPEWNDDLDCYCLNFYGRVKKASAKNFQIIYKDDPDNIILQHGKVSRDEFNIDFREPFNFIVAFGVSLVSIGKKRVVS